MTGSVGVFLDKKESILKNAVKGPREEVLMGFYVFTESISQGAGRSSLFRAEDLEVGNHPIVVDALVFCWLFFDLHGSNAKKSARC